MLVSDVVALAAHNLGREDLIPAIQSADKDTSGELASLLRAYNIVESEIALDYYPVSVTVTVTPVSQTIRYENLPYLYLNLAGITQNGVPVRYELRPADIYLPDNPKGSVKVEYYYEPEPKFLPSDCEFKKVISARLMSFGVACEYCLSQGRYDEAAIWEEKYRDALRAAGLLRRTLAMRSRRWA